MLCSLVDWCQTPERRYCHHFQGRRVSRVLQEHADIEEEGGEPRLRVGQWEPVSSWLICSPTTLKMDTVCFSETLIITRLHSVTPTDHNLGIHHCKCILLS
jgi:hypothetical protein